MIKNKSTVEFGLIALLWLSRVWLASQDSWNREVRSPKQPQWCRWRLTLERGRTGRAGRIREGPRGWWGALLGTWGWGRSLWCASSPVTEQQNSTWSQYTVLLEVNRTDKAPLRGETHLLEESMGQQRRCWRSVEDKKQDTGSLALRSKCLYCNNIRSSVSFNVLTCAQAAAADTAEPGCAGWPSGFWARGSEVGR